MISPVSRTPAARASLILLSFLATLAVTGCSSKDEATPVEDTGTADPPDTVTAETASPDTGAEETAPGDTSTEDTTVADTGTDDTGSGDTGSGDTGSDDTGAGDTGTADTDPDAPVTAFEFKPKPHGFKFENYGGDLPVTNLTAVEVQRMFGDAVCANTTGGVCTLTPPAERWRLASNKDMGGGHCEGFAALSLIFYQGVLKPASFGTVTNTFELELTDNVKLQRELAYWFVTQALEPTASATKKMAATEVLDLLTASFKPGGKEKYTLGIYKADFTGGHAITPFSVTDKGAGIFEIGVYDNNFPGEERAVTIDKGKNSWKYFASTSPSVPGSEYNGDATIKNLDLTPLSERLKAQQCPFCGEASPDGTVKPKGSAPLSVMREISLNGKAHLLITDSTGKRVGRSAGKLINEITGAKVLPTKGKDLWNDVSEPSYFLPLGTELTITLDGSELFAAAPSSVSVVMPAFTLDVDDIMLDPKQTDTIVIGKDGMSLTYKTKGMESPSLVLGVSTPTADWEFDLGTAGEVAGQEIVLKLDLAKGRLQLMVKGTGSSSYDIQIRRIDDTGVAVFNHKGDNILSSNIIYFDFAKWGGDKTPMTVELDSAGDGTIDSTYTITDD